MCTHNLPACHIDSVKHNLDAHLCLGNNPGLARWCSMRAAVQREFGEESSWWEALVDSGNYGDAATPDYRKWAIQVGQ